MAVKQEKKEEEIGEDVEGSFDDLVPNISPPQTTQQPSSTNRLKKPTPPTLPSHTHTVEKRPQTGGGRVKKARELWPPAHTAALERLIHSEEERATAGSEESPTDAELARCAMQRLVPGEVGPRSFKAVECKVRRIRRAD